jgi:hypothetical protein
LPKAETDYQIRNSDGFQLPDGVKFEFDKNDPTLAAARKFALDRGLDQETFSSLLDLHVASKVNELMAQARAHDTNLKMLGAAGPSRIDAVATWLKATAGADGTLFANFLKAYPSAPMVKAMENVIRRFSNQGGVNYDQRGRATQEDHAGRIPGYDQMSFTQRRAAQMKQMLRGSREK